MNRSSRKEFDLDASNLNHKAYTVGCDYYNYGDFKKAVKAFSESIEYWPKDYQAWHALGNCFDELNKPVKAESCYRKFLELAVPEKQDYALYNLGNSLLDQAKFKEAIQCYIKVSGQSTVYLSAQQNMERAKNGNSNKNS